MQRAADEMEGFRFYLPRGYVSVRKPFPVSSKSYLVNGTVSPDGKHILLGATKDDLSGVLQSIYVKEDRIPAGVVVKAKDDAGGAQNGKPADEQESSDPGPNSTGPTNTRSDTADKPGTGNQDQNQTEPPQNNGNGGTSGQQDGAATPPITGQGRVAVTTDNTQLAIIPINEYFDVVFLNDDAEQYAVNVRPRLGNANAALNYGAGGTLLGFNATVDNSDLNSFVFEQMRFMSDTAQKVSLNALGLPVLGAGESGDMATAMQNQGANDPSGAQSGLLSTENGTHFVPGVRVTLRVTVVDFATVGLHPIPKAREVEDVLSRHFSGKGLDQGIDELLDLRHSMRYRTFQYVLVEQLRNTGGLDLIQTSAPGGETGTVVPAKKEVVPSEIWSQAILGQRVSQVPAEWLEAMELHWEPEAETPRFEVKVPDADSMPEPYDESARAAIQASIEAELKKAGFSETIITLPAGADQLKRFVDQAVLEAFNGQVELISRSIAMDKGVRTIQLNFKPLGDVSQDDQLQGGIKALWNKDFPTVSDSVQVELIRDAAPETDDIIDLDTVDTTTELEEAPPAATGGDN